MQRQPHDRVPQDVGPLAHDTQNCHNTSEWAVKVINKVESYNRRESFESTALWGYWDTSLKITKVIKNKNWI